MKQVVTYKQMDLRGSDLAAPDGAMAASLGCVADVTGEQHTLPPLEELCETDPALGRLVYAHMMSGYEGDATHLIFAAYDETTLKTTLRWRTIADATAHDIAVVDGFNDITAVGHMLCAALEDDILYALWHDGTYVTFFRSELRFKVTTIGPEVTHVIRADAYDVLPPHWQEAFHYGRLVKEHSEVLLSAIQQDVRAQLLRVVDGKYKLHGHSLCVAALEMFDGSFVAFSMPFLLVPRDNLRYAVLTVQTADSMPQTRNGVAFDAESVASWLSMLVEGYEQDIQVSLDPGVWSRIKTLVRGITIFKSRSEILAETGSDIPVDYAVGPYYRRHIHHLGCMPSETDQDLPLGYNALTFDATRDALYPTMHYQGLRYVSGNTDQLPGNDNDWKGGTIEWQWPMPSRDALYEHLDYATLWESVHISADDIAIVGGGTLAQSGMVRIEEVDEARRSLALTDMSMMRIGAQHCVTYNHRLHLADITHLADETALQGIMADVHTLDQQTFHLLPVDAVRDLPEFQLSFQWLDVFNNDDSITLREGGVAYAMTVYLRGSDGAETQQFACGHTEWPMPPMFVFPDPTAYKVDLAVRIPIDGGQHCEMFKTSFRLHESKTGGYAYHIELDDSNTPVFRQAQVLTPDGNVPCYKYTADDPESTADIIDGIEGQTGYAAPTAFTRTDVWQRDSRNTGTAQFTEDAFLFYYQDQFDTWQAAHPDAAKVRRTNQIATSMPDNPVAMPASLTLTVGEGRIVGLAPAVRAVSEGQFGHTPMYVFTSTGIWTLAVAGEGYFQAVQPVSNTVCNNAASITQTRGGVLFTSEQGLMHISGGSVSCLSEPLQGLSLRDMDIPGLAALCAQADTAIGTEHLAAMQAVVQAAPRPTDFFAGCLLAVDDAERLIHAFRPDTALRYIRTRQGAWTMDAVDAAFGASVVMPPYTLLQTAACDRIVRIGRHRQRLADDDARAVMIVTRPLHFGDISVLKSVNRIVHKGLYDQQSLRMALYGTVDERRWFRMDSLRSTACKAFRLVIFAKLTPTEHLTGSVMDVVPVRNDKIR